LKTYTVLMASNFKISRHCVFTLVGLCFALALPGALANPIDNAILDKLERASEREQLRIAQDIKDRLRNEQPSHVIQKRLVDIVASSQNLSTFNYVTLLRELGSGAEFDEPTIIAVANGLASGIVHSEQSAQTLGELLIDYNEAKRLPDLALARVYEAIANSSRSNATPAIQVIKSIPVTDSRFIANVEVLVATLTAEYPYVRNSAIAALAHYSSQGSLPENAIAGLMEVATSDSHIHVRLDAYAALGEQEAVDPATLAQALSAELIEPTVAVWRASSGYTRYPNQELRAVMLLTDWLEAPYPGYVVDALIAKTPRQHTATLPLLAEVERQRPLSARQRSNLELIAQRHSRADVRSEIYQLIEGVGLDGSLEQLLSVMAHDSSATAQIQAGYSIERHYQTHPLPAAVAGVAERLLLTSEHAELRGIAARLVARSQAEPEAREQKLIAALKLHTGDDEIRKAWFSLYDNDQIETLVEKYVADESLVPWVRSVAVSELAKTAAPGHALSEEAYARMVYAARTTDSYMLNAAIFKTLRVWQAKVPLSVKLKYEPYQAKVLFTVFVILAFVFIVAGLTSLVKTLSISFPDPGRTTKRIMMLVLWLAFSMVCVAFFVFALFGFLGHNSAPSPKHTLYFNIPMYISVIVFLAYAWLVARWSSRSN
jgi:hypothetical protein